ncbi:MAG: transporter permease [Rariglobus sp.]|jgi:spermidine/putrescine transport system permease protein|nr:transporter permease [Rariglobus sp.]
MQALPSTSLTDSPHALRPRVWGWVLLAPMLAWLVLFVLVPMAILLVYSFCTRDDLGRVVFEFTFENYQRVFDPIYLRILGRSIGYAALTTGICLLMGYPVAWFIARQRENVRNWLLLLVMIPFWTSFLIRTYAWMTILKGNGLLSGLLLSAGVIPAPLEILYTPAAAIIGLVYAYLPFMILPIYGSAEKLDNALVEAAHDLGAGPVRAFSEVIVPLTWPGIAAGILLVFVPAIGMFAITDLMGGARVPMIGNVIHNQFIKAGNQPFGAALGIIFTLMFVVAYTLAQRRGRSSHP